MKLRKAKSDEYLIKSVAPGGGNVAWLHWDTVRGAYCWRTAMRGAAVFRGNDAKRHMRTDLPPYRVGWTNEAHPLKKPKRWRLWPLSLLLLLLPSCITTRQAVANLEAMGYRDATITGRAVGRCPYGMDARTFTATDEDGQRVNGCLCGSGRAAFVKP